MTVEKTYLVLSQEHLNDRRLILSVTGPIWPHSPQCLNVGQALRVDCGIGGEDDFVKKVVTDHSAMVSVQLGSDHHKRLEYRPGVDVQHKRKQADYCMLP